MAVSRAVRVYECLLRESKVLEIKLHPKKSTNERPCEAGFCLNDYTLLLHLPGPYFTKGHY